MLKGIISLLSITCLIIFCVSTSPAMAALTGSGNHLVMPSPNPPAPTLVVPTYTYNTTTDTFTGTWGSSAALAWQGTFSGTGNPTPGYSWPVPATVTYDFSTPYSPGFLPIGTTFRFGDLDYGSKTNEKFILTAKDASGNPLKEWLDPVYYVSNPSGGTNSMPGWSWDGGGAYTFDGTTVLGNPNIGIYLLYNQKVYSLDVQRFSDFANFSLHAPAAVPEPAALVLVGSCLAGVMAWRKKFEKRD